MTKQSIKDIGAKPKIKIVAIGGKACNILRRLNVLLKENSNVECVAIAKAEKIFNQVGDIQKVELRTEKDFSELDERSQEKISHNIIDEKKDEIIKALAGADIVFLLGNLSNSVNTMQTEQIMRLWSRKGVPTIFFGSTPFSFEGERQALVAAKSREHMTQLVDATIVVDNNKLLLQNLNASEALSMVDTLIENYVTALIDIVDNFGVINVDFNDFKTTIASVGEAFFNTAIGSEADIPQLLTDLFRHNYLDTGFDGMKKIIYVIKAGLELSADTVEKIGQAIYEKAGKDARIIFGIASDPLMKEKIQITLIAGQIVKIMPQPDEFDDFRNAALLDTLKALGPMSNEEDSYYKNLV